MLLILPRGTAWAKKRRGKKIIRTVYCCRFIFIALCLSLVAHGFADALHCSWSFSYSFTYQSRICSLMSVLSRGSSRGSKSCLKNEKIKHPESPRRVVIIRNVYTHIFLLCSRVCSCLVLTSLIRMPLHRRLHCSCCCSRKEMWAQNSS